MHELGSVGKLLNLLALPSQPDVGLRKVLTVALKGAKDKNNNLCSLS